MRLSRPGHWFRSYGLLLTWSLLRLRSMLVLFTVLQLVLSVSIVLGFAFLMPEVDQQSASYLATGAPTIGVIVVTMVIAPQIIKDDKLNGFFDYQRTLPVPRLATLAADATIWIAVSIPGIIAGLIAAGLRFDLDYRLSPMIAVALPLVAIACIALGYAIVYGLPPGLVSVVSQVLVFFVLLFSPITFPAERLPDWLAAVHAPLPLTYTAQAVRESLMVPAGGISWQPYAMLLLWGAIGLAVASWVMARRR
ncbi:ABC transporter permease [Salinactinospora qingdaonensis]|uniref:ABC transporter permease n=1 Tax=Salinactinospora qingdaonensis TaxID=702744 RepID=A0ABP7FHN3_9ACTN